MSEAHARLATLMDSYWALLMAVSPEFASSLGERSGDGQVSDLSLEAADANTAKAAALLAQVQAIPDANLNVTDRVNKAILARQLDIWVKGNGFGQRMMLFSSFTSWHQNFVSLAETSPFVNAADYASYLSRLAQFPRYNDQGIAVTRRAIAEHYVQPCLAMAGFADSITGVVVADPQKSRFYAPFLRPRPRDISPEQWVELQARARSLILDTLNPAYTKLADFYGQDYLPACRKDVGASALPDGARWYAQQVRAYTTTDMSVEDIHALGLKEVARIDARMDALARKAGYPDRRAYIAALKRDPANFATTPQALIAHSTAIAKQIDGLTPRYFGRLPRLPFTIQSVPAETADGTAMAYYQPGSMPARNAGVFFLNTSKLPERPLYSLPALTAHEAAPGHHFQIALQQELDLPKFRRYATYFVAYGEGWGLYTEYLGEEMGLYDTDAKMMGRLSFEAWRACRLVVDTGLHAKGWTKEQAKAFMRAHSAEAEANIEAEVNRYISWPGQALGYKVGEIRIRDLRTKAERELGPRFDLSAFHDAVLSQGSVPLDVLDMIVDQWIASVKAGNTET